MVDEIYDKWAASKMGVECKGQICVMIHSGSRGFGHQVATDALVQMEKAMKRDNIETNDRQLACARISSQEGQDYLKSMAAAANFAWVNRSSMTFLCRQVLRKKTCSLTLLLYSKYNFQIFPSFARLLPSNSIQPRTILICTLYTTYPTI